MCITFYYVIKVNLKIWPKCLNGRRVRGEEKKTLDIKGEMAGGEGGGHRLVN